MAGRATCDAVKSDRSSPTFQGNILVKANPVTGRGGPEDFETSRLPHFLDNRLTDGGKVVSLTLRHAGLYPRKISGSHF
jgi:inner membrane protein involved in colicin E2 resistance